MSLRGVPLQEIRRRFLHERVRVKIAELDELESDPRSGAREVARMWRARRERRTSERRRLSRLFALERAWRRGAVAPEAGPVVHVAGVDEVGMGPLAGPVVAAAVILPAGTRLEGLDDSKRVVRARRERLDREIRSCALGVSIGLATREEIDGLNIYHAGLLAMRRAVESLRPVPGVALVDGRAVPGLDVPQRAVVGGDGRVGAIAAASIVAKVRRDQLMCELARRYPGYGFEHNAGYSTAEHRRALAQHGPTPEHRRSFATVREAGRSSCRML